VADQVGAPTAAAVIADALVHILSRDAGALRAKFCAAGGLIHLAAAGTTSWHGFATAIVEGLRLRQVAVRTNRVIAIRSDEYLAKAARPRNCRLALGRLAKVFGIITPGWSEALAPELDLLADMLHAGNPPHPGP